MADGTKIEWTDATVNAVNGCTRVSPGCGGPNRQGGCYAERLAGTRLRNHPSRAGLTRQTSAGPRWTGEVRLNEAALLQPLRWKRPRRIFWNAHGDLFHEKVPDGWIDRVFAVCALTPQHQHQILTKRPERMREYFAGSGAEDRVTERAFDYADIHWGRDEAERRYCFGNYTWPLPNVWLGVSVEDRPRMLQRAVELKAIPAAVYFWSAEPLLGDLGEIPDDLMPDWVIVGGESGPGARPMHPDWARALRDQCTAAGVPFFFKQWGEWAPTANFDADYPPPNAPGMNCQFGDCFGEADEPIVWRVGKKAAGRLLAGVEHNAFPMVQP